MKAVIAAGVCVALLVTGASANDILFYFSRSNSLDVVPPEFLAGEVPDDLLVDEPVYLWAFVEPTDTWNGVALDFLGPDVAAGEMYNPSTVPGERRWNLTSDLNPVGDNYVFAVAVTEWGLGDPIDPLHVFRHFLVGDMSFAQEGEVRLGIGTGGIARRGGNPNEDDVYFGFDPWGEWDPAERIWPNQYADVVVIPEPAAGLLAILAGLVATGRRRK